MVFNAGDVRQLRPIFILTVTATFCFGCVQSFLAPSATLLQSGRASIGRSFAPDATCSRGNYRVRCCTSGQGLRAKVLPARSTSSSTESSTESNSTSPSDELPPQTTPNERLEPAPSTFEQCIRQAQGAVEAAFKDGFNLVEVEFPPLQQDYLEDSGSSAYDVSSANVRLASRFAQTFAAEGKEVSVLLPDEAELDRAVEDEGSAEFSAGVTLRTLRSAGTRTAETLDKLLMSFVGRGAGPIQPLGGTDIYVAIVFSCQELPDLEELHKQDPKAKIVLFNLRLDTLRGDLGLPAFPPKSLHYRFLSRFKPVYLLRTRQYSRTISKKPFLVNYQGAQFRVYPGDYQCLLDVGNRYKRVQNSPVRQTLGDFKESLTNALQLNEEKEGKVASFFRKGFKNRTWWEEVSAEEVSSNWRT